jgi:hypothetical protein
MKPKHEPQELKGLRYKPVEHDEADIAPELRGLRAKRVEEEEPVDEATRRGSKRLATK